MVSLVVINKKRYGRLVLTSCLVMCQKVRPSATIVVNARTTSSLDIVFVLATNNTADD